MAEAELWESMERAFEEYGKPMENVSAFKYLGRVMTAVDDDWPSVVGNLLKAQKSWGRFSRILFREGAEMRVSGNFFKAVVQEVFLFGAETWVLTPRMKRSCIASSTGPRAGSPGENRGEWGTGPGRILL